MTRFWIWAVALLAGLLVVWLVARYMRTRRAASASTYAYGAAAADAAKTPRQYSPDKIGNDASARPWERTSMMFDAGRYTPPSSGVRNSPAPAGPQDSGVPAGFDAPSFVAAARQNFIALQEAWDRADFATLRALMTDEMLGEIQAQLAERERQLGGKPNRTEVVMLEAQLWAIEHTATGYMASVEFSGLIREDASAGPNPFREVWTMTKPRDGANGWLVAGVEALQ